MLLTAKDIGDNGKEVLKCFQARFFQTSELLPLLNFSPAILG